jgi:hypothetical protein
LLNLLIHFMFILAHGYLLVILLCSLCEDSLLFCKSCHVDGVCNTACYGSPNPSLITVISGLVMHYMPKLINPESSQRGFGFNLNLNH